MKKLLKIVFFFIFIFSMWPSVGGKMIRKMVQEIGKQSGAISSVKSGCLFANKQGLPSRSYYTSIGKIPKKSELSSHL